MGGFQDTWEASQWSHDSVVQAVGTCASGPNESCAYLYLMPNAEGPFFFSNTEQKTTACAPSPPPFFLELKSMSFGSLCILGRVSTVPQDTVVENIWNFPTLQEKGLGTVGGLGLVFQFLVGVRQYADTDPGTGACLVASPVCFLSQWGWGENFARAYLPLGFKKIKKSNQKVWRNGCIVNNAFLSFLVKFFLKKEKKV